MELLTVVKSVHKHSQIWDRARAIRKTKGRNHRMSPVLQGTFRPAAQTPVQKGWNFIL